MIDLHTHSVFSDGKNTPAEMVTAALQQGLTTIGFADHAFVSFDSGYCMRPDEIFAYKNAVRALKQQYAGQIQVLCGIEQDLFADLPADGYDFIIGSVHYVKADDQYISVDESSEMILDGVRKYFGGDLYAFAEVYFEEEATIAEQTNCDIIGHFDLIAKTGLFDESHPRYQAALRKAVTRLLASNTPFEINTGGIARGYRTVPYPAPQWIDEIRAQEGRFVLSSDSHDIRHIAYRFEEFEAFLR